jgi:hypothetical protein
MNSPSVFARFGTTARDCLADGQRGKILAVFSKVIYLLTEADELFWITTGDALMHRRCAKITSPLPGLEAGARFQVQNHLLTVDPGFAFEIGNPPLWISPRAIHVLDAASLFDFIRSIFFQLDFSQAGGFGNFMPQILRLFQNESPLSSAERNDPILRFSQPLVLSIARASLERRPSTLPEAADKLIGLGAGLTPSGDDFLGGFLFATHHLRAEYPRFDFTNYNLQIEAFRSRTHPISFALLKDHASGYSLEPLHQIVNGILGGESFEKISPSVLQLTQIGHSTGWDLLTGLLVGLMTVKGVQSPHVG